MKYEGPSDLAKKKIDAIGFAGATMDRSLVKAGLRFGKEVGKEYGKALALTGDISHTFSAVRKSAIQEASIWLANNCSVEFMENSFETIVNEAMEPLLRNPAFKGPDEIDQVSTYFAQAAMSIFLEDAGFMNSENAWVVKTLRKPWTSVFGSSVFLIRS